MSRKKHGDQRLVGMTMGARRREMRRRLATIWLVEPDAALKQQTAREIRAEYRLGERLRPCRGCPDCDPQCPLGLEMWAPDPTCDGSGVLPARKASRPCRGCEQCDQRLAEALSAPRSEYDGPIDVDGPCNGSGVLPAQQARIYAALAWCEDSAGMVLAVKTGDRGWHLPGGKVEPGEDPAAAALREMYEEAGVRGRVLGLIYSGPSYNGKPMHVYRVEPASLIIPSAQVAVMEPETLAERYHAPFRDAFVRVLAVRRGSP